MVRRVPTRKSDAATQSPSRSADAPEPAAENRLCSTSFHARQPPFPSLAENRTTDLSARRCSRNLVGREGIEPQHVRNPKSLDSRNEPSLHGNLPVDQPPLAVGWYRSLPASPSDLYSLPVCVSRIGFGSRPVFEPPALSQGPSVFVLLDRPLAEATGGAVQGPVVHDLAALVDLTALLEPPVTCSAKTL